jgi:excisionase family DNA binding protein
MSKAASPELLTVKEVARLLRLAEHTVYRRMHRGQIPAIRIGDDDMAPLRIPRDELYAMLYREGKSDASAV